MASVVIAGDTSGTVTLAAPAVAGTTTLTLPTANGTVITTGSSGQSIPKAALPTGSVLQVVSTTKTDTFTTTSTSFVDVTGASVSITPLSASSKILVMAYIVMSNATATAGSFFRVVRDSTAIGVGTAVGNRIAVAGNLYLPAVYSVTSFGWHYLDSPASTSSLAYKIQVAGESGYTATVGRSGSDGDFSYIGRTPTIITVMEIAA